MPFFLGDRPMTTPGYGPALDELDAVCLKYKDCVKCAMAEFGGQCFGEVVKYQLSLKGEEIQELILKKKLMANLF